MDNSLKDRMPPYHLDAEKAVIGAIMIDSAAISEVLPLIRPDDFYRPEHQKILSAIFDLYNEGQKIDIITIVEKLKSTSELDLCGGTSYIASLPDLVPSAANVKYYAQLVQDRSWRRTILHVASTLLKDAHDESIEARELLEISEQKIFDLNNSRKRNDIRASKDVVQAVIKQIEFLHNNKDKTVGVPTGFDELDDYTQGFQKSDFVVIGARPSIGKTAFALSLASNMAIRQNIPVGFFSLEMSAELLIQRILSGESKINSQKLRTGSFLHQKDFSRLLEAAGRVYEAPLYIDDTPNIKLLDLRANARRMCKEWGVKIIFIDYIGIMTSERSGNIPRHEQVAEFSRSLKALARELEIPIITLAQVGRESEGAEPTLANLRDSGSIEQDADIVMFLHRKREESAQKEGEPVKDVIDTSLIVAKQRNGPTGIVKLNFVKNYTRFENPSYEKES